MTLRLSASSSFSSSWHFQSPGKKRSYKIFNTHYKDQVVGSARYAGGPGAAAGEWSALMTHLVG